MIQFHRVSDDGVRHKEKREAVSPQHGVFPLPRLPPYTGYYMMSSIVGNCLPFFFQPGDQMALPLAR
jgi:hypothetical protein